MTTDAAAVKVFLADDSRMICDRLATMLADDGMIIAGAAHTPQDCIAGVLASHPDVVVLDVQLEGGTGLQVLRAVRQLRPDIAFVVFSINVDAAHRKLYLASGAHSFLDKATDFERLVQSVRAAAHPAP
jgi:two-component system response regulator DesR